mmetsp:Transcript_4/g.11  ORF Transcript_4/g.11 Transcript_4/m.11 type:complete len:688 (-) Transcript_4:1081-3144(-)|eukprot:CAMPEP_0203749162 /NCGR_PEP_ID=MMETSP0098-20131031/3824_1 /ASSEMBLY_ACC=CAM_ASM_000208 /TAXON_ID=96639 /ORGANISM=" , Strain NY0313808BC1" /LENGTH=687 /DNA_ID=CAMNT_0050638141 /DNA_START=394 /DNA_END=2457 /DNA_ORIENTATION=-
MAGRGRDMVLPAWASRKDQHASGRVGQQVPQGRTDGNSPSSGQRPSNYVTPDGWTQHVSDDGKVYYYNRITQQSTYEKPLSLMDEVERKLPKTMWKQYSRDGKAYYFNAQTNESVWEEPMEFTRYKERLRGMCAGDAPTKDVDSMALFRAARAALDEILESTTTNEQPVKNVKKNVIYSAAASNLTRVSGELKAPAVAIKKEDYTEEIEAFRKMLEDRKVPSDATWVVAISHGIANDAGFDALPGKNRRRSAFEAYLAWKSAKEDQEKLEVWDKAKSAVVAGMQQLAEKGEIDGHSRRKVVLEKLEQAGESLKTSLATLSTSSRKRDDIILDFLDKLYDEQKAARRKAREAQTAAFADSLSKSFSNGVFTLDSEWSTTLRDSILEGPLDQLKSADMESAFKSFLEIKREEIDRRNKELAEKIKVESKALCDKFADWFANDFVNGLEFALPQTLKALCDEQPDNAGKGIFSHLAFQDIEKLGANKDVALDILGERVNPLIDKLGANKDVALDILGERVNPLIDGLHAQVDTLRRNVRKDLKKAKATVEAIKYKEIQQATNPLKSLDELVVILGESKPEVEQASSVVKHTLFKRLQDDADKKVERKMEDFEDMLADILCKPHHVGLSYDEALPKISKEPEFSSLQLESKRKEIFQVFMNKLVAKKKLSSGTKRHHDDGYDSRSYKKSKS